VLDFALKASTGAVALYESKNEIAEYATLSYSWGKSLPLTTTSSNIEQYRKGLPIQSLPQTLRDAVRKAQLLNFRYLWNDALCIIQDDAADWAVQAASMTDIYEGSTLCISALSAKDCNSGFLKLRNILSKVGICRYPTESFESRDIFVGWKPYGYGNVVEKSYLCTRGWTFPERLVSPASLYYTDEGMFWECAEKFVSETGSGTTPYSPTGWKKAGMGRRLCSQNTWEQVTNFLLKKQLCCRIEEILLETTRLESSPAVLAGYPRLPALPERLENKPQ
jgi:hypothetical protein